MPIETNPRPSGGTGDARHADAVTEDLALSPLGEAALTYIALGWPVIPLKPGQKVPLIPKSEGGNGVHDASLDRAQVEAWWTRWPDANIGVAAGPAFWVLDVDFAGWDAEQADGADSIAALVERFGELPATVQQITGSGGWQRFYLPDEKAKNGVRRLPGIDTRAAGGYAVLPPSVHPCGATYRWARGRGPDEMKLAAAPPWLLAMLFAELPQEAPPPIEPIRWTQESRGRADAYGRAALEGACGRIVGAPVGSQCDLLERESFGLGRLVGAGILPRPLALAALVAAGRQMRSATGPRHRPWTQREIGWRVDRALAAGEAKPRLPEGLR